MTELTKPRLPRGLADRGPADLAATARIIDAIRSTYELYGFEAVETPFIEYTDALGKFLPDLDRPNAGVFSFKDDDDQWLSLRYDLTAPLARSFAERYDALPKPYRSYRFGPVFRNEKPGPGRFRQFLQFDADTVGSASTTADAEICMMAADTMEQLGIKRGDYVIRVNNRKILDGVMEGAGLGGPENAARRLIVMRALDKYDRLGWDGVHALLGAGRRDDSGDVTKGADLNFDQMMKVTSVFVRGNSAEAFRRMSKIILENFNNPEDFEGAYETVRATIEAQFYVEDLSSIDGWTLENDDFFFPLQLGKKTYKFFSRNRTIIEALRKDFRDNELYNKGVSELEEMVCLFDAAGYGSRRILIDPSVVRGLEYYTGPVFEAELLFEVKDDDGQPVRFGSVGGGGRYDGLVARFRGEPVPATGFSVGVSRLVAALRAVKSPLVGSAAPRGPVVVAVLDRGEMARYQGLVTRLRAAGIASELYLGASGMNAQLKYADKRNSPCAVLQGSNERDAAGGPVVMVRDLRLGAELAKGSKDRSDYLELRQRAQFAVPEDGMVEAVREVLARGGGPERSAG